MAIHVYPDHYSTWTDEDKQRAEVQYQLLVNNIDLLLTHQRKILDNPEYFFSEIDTCFCSILFGSGGQLYLGFLLIGWADGTLIDECPNCSGKFLVTGIGGSLISGNNSFWGFCLDCREKASRLHSPERVFHDRCFWSSSLRRNYPRRRQEWQEYDGHQFSWGGKGLLHARKRTLVTIDLLRPVEFELLIPTLERN